MKRASIQDLLVFGLYLLLGAFGMYQHEMWLDELQHWCLGRDSHSLTELVRNTSGEGHPLLWNLLLYLITRVTNDPFWMQVVHFLIAVSAMGVFLFKAPLPRAVRYLSLFGYFALYEYLAISRNYALGMLLLFLVCAVWPKREQRPLLLALLLALMMQVHLWSLTIALVFTALWAFEMRKCLRPLVIAGLALVLLSLALALAHMIPPAGSPYGIQWDGLFTLKRIGQALSSMTFGMLPLPDPSLSGWWNSNVFYSIAKWLPALMGALLLLAITLGIKGSKARFFFFFGALGVMAFPFLMLYKGVRYHGPLFLLLLAALWILVQEGQRMGKLLRGTLYTVLAIQLIGGMTALVLETNSTFSQARATVEHIKAHYPDLPVVVSHYSAGPSISGYLGKPVFYPNQMGYGSYCDWLAEPFQLSAEETLERIDELPFEEYVFLSPAEFPETPEGFVLDTAFIGSVVQFEEYYLFLKTGN